MNQVTQLQILLTALLERKGVEALRVLGAVAGIPHSRMVQLAKGEGAAPTVMEITTINMLM